MEYQYHHSENLFPHRCHREKISLTTISLYIVMFEMKPFMLQFASIRRPFERLVTVLLLNFEEKGVSLFAVSQCLRYTYKDIGRVIIALPTNSHMLWHTRTPHSSLGTSRYAWPFPSMTASAVAVIVTFLPPHSIDLKATKS